MVFSRWCASLLETTLSRLRKDIYHSAEQRNFLFFFKSVSLLLGENICFCAQLSVITVVPSSSDTLSKAAFQSLPGVFLEQ